MGSDEERDKDRARAAEILGQEFQFPPVVEGELTFLYDFYLKFKRAGFNEKQALWLCADALFGGHLVDEDNPEMPKGES